MKRYLVAATLSALALVVVVAKGHAVTPPVPVAPIAPMAETTAAEVWPMPVEDFL